MDTTLPSANPEEMTETIGRLFNQPHFWSRLLYAVLLLLCCMVVMRVLNALVSRTIQRLKVEKSLHTLIRATVKILLWFVTIVVVLSYLGIDPTSLIALLSVAGIAVSLAVQGTLSNLAGGLMILGSKPFKVGDYIDAGGVSGTVAEIGMVYTRIKTIDNKVIHVPNGEISTEKITNYSSQATRQVELRFAVSYDAPVEQATAAILAGVAAHPKGHGGPPPFARVSAYNDSSIQYLTRAWCDNGDYWEVYYDLQEQVKAAFDREGIEMTYNHLNVHIMDK